MNAFELVLARIAHNTPFGQACREEDVTVVAFVNWCARDANKGKLKRAFELAREVREMRNRG